MKKKKVFKIQTISVYISTTLVLLLLGIMGVLFIGAQSLSRNVKENILVTGVFNNSVEEDDILILCSDGLTNFVSEEEILKILTDFSKIITINKKAIALKIGKECSQ